MVGKGVQHFILCQTISLFPDQSVYSDLQELTGKPDLQQLFEGSERIRRCCLKFQEVLENRRGRKKTRLIYFI